MGKNSIKTLKEIDDLIYQLEISAISLNEGISIQIEFELINFSNISKELRSRFGANTLFLESLKDKPNEIIYKSISGIKLILKTKGEPFNSPPKEENLGDLSKVLQSLILYLDIISSERERMEVRLLINKTFDKIKNLLK